MVYNSIPSVAPSKKDIFPKKSEYGAQFKSWDEDQGVIMEDGPAEIKQQKGSPEKQKRAISKRMEKELVGESKARISRSEKADKSRQRQNQDDSIEISKNSSKIQVWCLFITSCMIHLF